MIGFLVSYDWIPSYKINNGRRFYYYSWLFANRCWHLGATPLTEISGVGIKSVKPKRSINNCFTFSSYCSHIFQSYPPMKKKQLSILLLLLIFISTSSFNILPKDVIRNDFKKYYDKFNVRGSFVIYSQNEDAYTYYNKEQTFQAFTPASTFKICNTLISLDSKVINDENAVIKWDGKERQNPAWNHDTNMRDAFKIQLFGSIRNWPEESEKHA